LPRKEAKRSARRNPAPAGDTAVMRSERMDTAHEKNRANRDRYDILDYLWEMQYRKWRPQLLSGVSVKCSRWVSAPAGTCRTTHPA
jgi:hypothetical protein